VTLRTLVAAVSAVLLLGAGAGPAESLYAGFSHPERVTIVGYTGDAWNRSSPATAVICCSTTGTSRREDRLFYAERIDVRTYRFAVRSRARTHRNSMRSLRWTALDAVLRVHRKLRGDPLDDLPGTLS